MNPKFTVAITNTTVIAMMGIVIIITTANPIVAITVGIIVILAAITELVFYHSKTLSDSIRQYCMTCTTLVCSLLFSMLNIFLRLRCFS